MTLSKPKPTLADVAKTAGVSIMTVSNVVNGRADLVREKTRARVLRAVQALGYRPHIHARALRLSRTWTIGMLVTARLSDLPGTPWFSKVLAGLCNHLNEHGYGLLLHSHSPQALDDSTLLKWSRTDALVALVSGSSEQRRQVVEKLSRLDQPVVTLQEPDHPERDRDVAVVRQDDFGGGVKLAEHLLGGAARKLVFIRPHSEWPAMSERTRGMSSMIKRVRKASLKTIGCADVSYAAVEAVVTKELEEHGLPDAFVGANEAIALATLGVLEANGHRVPQDLLLGAFNASELWFFAKRKITTIGFPAYEVGTRAGHKILERLNQGKFSSRVEVLPAELIVGDTTDDERTLGAATRIRAV
jgi:LacI family transcriptional regulator